MNWLHGYFINKIVSNEFFSTHQSDDFCGIDHDENNPQIVRIKKNIKCTKCGYVSNLENTVQSHICKVYVPIRGSS